MKGHYDVIIAGAGPAGSTAGYMLCRSGLDVVIIDRMKFPREKLCAGLLTHKTINLTEKIFGESRENLKKNNIINFESNIYEVRAGDRVIISGSFHLPFCFVDRIKYDDFLLSKCIENGAEFIGGDGVVSVDMLKSSAITASGRTFTADVIIGADGVNSRMRRSFPVDLFGRDDWTSNVASTHEVFIERTRISCDLDHPVLYFDLVQWGYAWAFPNRDVIKLGICALKNKNSQKILSAFRRFLAYFNLKKSDDLQIRSHMLPYGCYLPEPVFRNLILIGDAAGFADPLLGEGIYYAQKSGELAATAILEAYGTKDFNENLRDLYTNSLRRHIFSELEYAEKIRNIMFRYLNLMGWLPLKILLALTGSMPVETVHGLRSYKWMRKQG